MSAILVAVKSDLYYLNSKRLKQSYIKIVLSNMPDILQLKIDYGISIFSQYKVIFNYLLDKKIVDEIHYCLNREIIEHYRGNYPIDYIIDMKTLVEFLFNDPRIIQIDNNSFNPLTTGDLQTKFDLPKKLVLDYIPLISEEPIIKENYITINTKIVDIDLNILSTFIPTLLHILKNSNYTIVIIGEKNMSECLEYKIHKDYFGCIYNDLISANLKYIDMTYPETYNGYSIESVKRSMNLSKYAKHNIIMNSGGALALGLGFGNVIGLTKYEAKYYHSSSHIFSFPSQINDFLIAITKNISSLKVDLLNPEVC